MAAPPRMLDQFLHPLRRRGTLQVHMETEVVKGSTGTFQAQLVGDIKAAPSINFTFLDRNIVQMREPRNLGEESKRGAHEQKG